MLDKIKIKEYFIKTRRHTDDLCRGVSAEDMMLQAVFFVSPWKWVLGHTSWFFEEMILKKKKNISYLIQNLIFCLIVITII